MAIASATLKYFLEDVQSLTLFVSHYPIFKQFEGYESVRNYHMSFIEQPSTSSQSQSTDVVFLYKLADGIAGKSYGLNVARLAGIPSSIIEDARMKAQQLEQNVKSLR